MQRPLEAGPRFTPGEPEGYFIDLRVKADNADWRPPADPSLLHWVEAIQWGLGCWERHLAGDGPQWRDAAQRMGDYLLLHQRRGDHLDGAWVFGYPFPHTYRLEPPWVMAMAQGEGASLLLRLAAATGRNDLREAAVAAMRPLGVAVADGGVRSTLPSGGTYYEEYPTTPPSHVLNGGIFTLVGAWEVAQILGDPIAERHWTVGIAGLLAGLFLWDLGYWSRYDLSPGPVPNVASPFYHQLHITQLAMLERIADDPRISLFRRRFERQASRRLGAGRAWATKAGFRLLTPRHPFLARLSDRRRGR